MPAADYTMGHSALELDRLMAQAAVMRPVTERLLLKAGLRAGMRVLDIGCGAGDVALLAAERVGPTGRVTGIDTAAKAVALARHRAEQDGFGNTAFHLADDPERWALAPFDFAIGRYVLLHQSDPADFIRAVAARVRRGGIIAFHEVDLRARYATLPPAPYFDAATEGFIAPLRTAVPTPDAGARLVSLFVAAGLPVPKLFCERIAGGADDMLLLHSLATNIVAGLALNGAQEPARAVDSVAAALRTAVAESHSQILCLDQCCAWVKL